MSESKYLNIYLRRTNGTGQKISVNPLITCRLLYAFIGQNFKLSEKQFELYFKGTKIEDSSEIVLENIKIQPQSIIHIKQKAISPQDIILLRVFCQGSLYSYQTNRSSTVQSLKYEMVKRLGCKFQDITISYLGRSLLDCQTLLQNQINDKQLLSTIVCTSTFSQRSTSYLKPKLTESLTFAPSQQIELNYQPFSKQVMRKSSMKSSRGSRQFKVEETKRMLQAIRPKSQSKLNTDQIEAQQSLNLLKLPWLSSQKMIQTESINFDDPEQDQQNPQNWKQCKLQLTNEQNSVFYTLECSGQHNLKSIMRKICMCQKIAADNTVLVFPDQLSQKMAQQGCTILEIARKNNTKIIHNVIFKSNHESISD